MNNLELEYKQETGTYPKKKIYGNTTRSGGIFLPSDEITEWYYEMDTNGYMEITSKNYVEWLENKVQELCKSN